MITRISLICLPVLVAAMSVRADSHPRWSDDQLANFSEAIVMGRVSDVASGRDSATGVIHTYVTIAVDWVFKGDISERVITVKQMGGQNGDEEFHVLDQAHFAKGEDVLLYLEVRPRDKTLDTSALWQGKWNLDRDVTTGERIATRLDPDAQQRGILYGDAERRVLSTWSARLTTLAAAPAGATGRTRSFVVEPPADEMKSVTAPLTAVQPFTLLGPFRWNEFDTKTAIPLDVQSSGQPGLAGGGTSELAKAIAVWSGAAGLTITSTGNSTSRCFGQGPFDGHISIIFNDPCGDISNTGGTIATGGASFFNDGKTVNGVAFGRATPGYYASNEASDVLPFLTNSGCVQFISTHELGHLLGMGHSADTTAIMLPSVSVSACSGGSPGPSADDLAGIRFIYPGGTTTPTTSAPSAPTRVTTSSSGSSVSISWTAGAAGGAATTYIIEAESASGLANLATVNTGSTATSFAASGVGTTGPNWLGLVLLLRKCYSPAFRWQAS